MMLTLAALAVAQSLIRVSEYQDGAGGMVEKRAEVHADGTWTASLIFPSGKGREVRRGKLEGARLDKLRGAVDDLKLTGEESHGEADMVNEHYAVIESRTGTMAIRGLSVSRGQPLEECLGEEAHLGPRVLAASVLVGQVESICR